MAEELEVELHLEEATKLGVELIGILGEEAGEESVERHDRKQTIL